MKKEFSNLFIFWQCGQGSKKIKKSLEDQKILHIVKEYTEKLDTWISASDLVFSRAGACTLAEIKALGKKSIIIPLKGVDDHQLENAKEHSRNHPSKIIDENSETSLLLKAMKNLDSEKKPPRVGLENSKKISELIFD